MATTELSMDDGGVRGDDDDLKPGASGEERGNQVEARGGFEAQVDEGDVEMLADGFGKGVGSVADGDRRMAVGFETDGQGFSDIGVIIHNQNPQRGNITLAHGNRTHRSQ
jgi:hypothetical protein